MFEDGIEEQPEAKLPTCAICNKSFRYKNSLRQHLEQAKHAPTSDPGEEVPKRLRCTMCDRPFNKEYWLRKHMWTKHASKVPASVKPAEDSKPSPSSQNPAVDSDAPIKQEDLKQEDQDQDSVPTVFRCAVCNKTFNGQYGLDRHTKAKHNPEPQEGRINCKLCRKSFGDDSALQKHHRDTHNQGCAYCKKGFPTKAALEEHKRRSGHKAGNASIEDVSGDAEENQDAKKEVPESENTEDKTSNKEGEDATESYPALLECEDCGDAEFYDFDSLYKHLKYFCRAPWARWMRVLMGLASPEHVAYFFKCEFCPQVFHTYAALDDHQEFLSHGPYWDGSKRKKPLKKRYEGQCDANWAERDPTLAYRCDECGETFPRMESFVTHSWSQHEIVLRHPNDYLERLPPVKVPEKTVKSGYRCTHCDVPFSSEDLLAKHWESTHDEEWEALFDHDGKKLNYKKNKIPCITCWRKFRTKSEMMLHVETGKCHSYLDTDLIKSAIQKSDQSVVSRIYTSDGKFQCPNCSHISLALSDLIFHAQSRECSLSIHRGPLVEFISEMRWRLIEEAWLCS